MASRTPFSAVTGFFGYLLRKRGEIDRLNLNDLLLTKLVLDIHRKRTKTGFERLKLHSIEPIHPIDREGALVTAVERAKVLERHRDEILRTGLVDREFMAKHLPSISWIKAVRCGEERYVSFEGNGRIGALQKVFTAGDGIDVEVEVYHFRNTAKMQRRINRVRRHYGIGKAA